MGLQIWLPLNGDLKNKGLLNSIIQSNNITVDNSGKLSTCYSFNGTDSFISLTNIYNIFKGDNNPFSMTMWLYSSDSNDRSVLFGDYGLNGSVNTNLEKRTDGKIRFYWGNGVPDLIFNSILNDNEWVHLSLTYNGQKICSYINGQLSDSKQVTLASLNKTSGLFYIGRDARTGATALNGKMNDFRLYDECLSPMQIKLISQGLVAHYLLNNNGSGNNNLIPNQGEYTVNNPFVWSSNKIDGSKWIPNSAFEIKPSTTYTFSLCCDGNLQTKHLPKPEPSPEEKAFTAFLYLSNDGTTKSWQTGQYDTTINLNSSNFSHKQIGQRHIWTFTTSSTQRYISIRVNNYSNGIDTLTLNYWNFKLEEGNKETPWCPNSTDSIYTQLGYDNNIEYDVSGYCNNGTKYNITDYTSDTPRYSVATKFNGTNSYINIGRGGMVRDEITINIWGYMDDWTKYNTRLISCTEGGGWNFEAPSGKIHFAIGTGSTSNTYKGTSGYTLSELSSGWHMFTGTYDGFTTKQYIDGVFNTSNNAYTTKTPIYYNSNSPILIGAEATSSSTTTGGAYFNGLISDVRIYATALSESDIVSLYNNSAFVDSSGNIYATEYVES